MDAADDTIRRDHGFHQLRVKGIIQETADTRSLVLDVPAGLRDTFAYRPGQFCTFRIPVGDEPPLRCYSMSSAPETDADLTVTVKRVPAGAVSNWLNDNVADVHAERAELARPVLEQTAHVIGDVEDERSRVGGLVDDRLHPQRVVPVVTEDVLVVSHCTPPCHCPRRAQHRARPCGAQLRTFRTT